jgi:protein TonB
VTSGADHADLERVSVMRWLAAALIALGLHAGGAALAFVHWNEEEHSEEAAGPIMVELAAIAVAPNIDAPDVAHGPLMEEAAVTPEAAKEIIEEVEKELPMVEQAPLAPEPEVAMPIPTPVEEKKPEEEKEEAKPQEQSPTQQATAPLTTAPPKVEAAPAEVAAAPSPGASPVTASVDYSWQRAIVSHLNRYKRYPDKARDRGLQGSVSVEFTIDRRGRVIAARVAQTSGSSSLDDEALAVLQRASPLPAPPASTPGTSFDMALPIQFRIRQ